MAGKSGAAGGRSSFGFIVFFLFLGLLPVDGQGFYFGADQSYVNEMEDCGALYQEAGEQKDVYDIYQDHGCNLVRLRLWHSPAWYDELNDGRRYGDLQDVQVAIARAKAHDMDVLLAFHLSDNWADPSRQLVPAAWLHVVDQLALLKDSLYNYVYTTLNTLAEANLLPEMVQIGNETNKGILLSPGDNQGWTLDWPRNSELFNSAIRAVRDIERDRNVEIRVAIHLAGPADTGWFVDNFAANGVHDFDIIGMSYYWAWHQPTTTAETAQVIRTLRQKYPGKEVLIVETAYIWTHEQADQANNIINEVHPDYAPPSPELQRDWLIDLTTKVIDSGGIGVIYWEPSWVSTPCWTQWGQGSHQEHASFFDFDHNLLLPGGIEWMKHEYGLVSRVVHAAHDDLVRIEMVSGERIRLIREDPSVGQCHFYLADSLGRILLQGAFNRDTTWLDLQAFPAGYYGVSVKDEQGKKYSRSVILSR